MSERYAEAMQELRELLNDIGHRAQFVMYGNFPGGDPNNFSPDPECSTEAEREAHKKACEAWNRGEFPTIHTGGTPENMTADKLPEGFAAATIVDGRVVHYQVQPFGLGTYSETDPEAEDWYDRLARCLARLEDS